MSWESDPVTRQHLSGAEVRTVAGGGHFLSLDRPREVEELITKFATT